MYGPSLRRVWLPNPGTNPGSPFIGLENKLSVYHPYTTFLGDLIPCAPLRIRAMAYANTVPQSNRVAVSM